MKNARYQFAWIAIALLVAGCAGPQTKSGSPQAVAQSPTDGPTSSGVSSHEPVATKNPYPLPSRSTNIQGSGATFPKPLLETWALEFAQQHSTVRVSYAGGGSGKGITDITKKDVLFAGSDAPLSATEKQNAPSLLHIPETLGLVAVVYNVDGVPSGLALTGELVGKIMTGQITRWNDAAIAAVNTGVTLPDTAIVIVYRSDSSGTTYVFTDWLAKSSTSWTQKMGSTPSKKPDWTKSQATQMSGNGNDGVATTVRNNKNSIGYVEYAYVKALALKAANVATPTGEFVAPSPEGAQKAVATLAASLPSPNGDWSKVSITFANATGAYPVSSLTYILVHNATDAYGGRFTTDQMNGFRAWLWWGLHDGQDRAEPLGYARLPHEIVSAAEQALASIRA